MERATEIAIQNIETYLNEIKEYFVDICQSLRVLSKRPDLDKEPINLME